MKKRQLHEYLSDLNKMEIEFDDKGNIHALRIASEQEMLKNTEKKFLEIVKDRFDRLECFILTVRGNIKNKKRS